MEKGRVKRAKLAAHDWLIVGRQRHRDGLRQSSFHLDAMFLCSSKNEHRKVKMMIVMVERAEGPAQLIKVPSVTNLHTEAAKTSATALPWPRHGSQ